MSAPGWFPDPAGVPGRFRYWDGTTWSPTTTTDPSSVPPGGGGPAGQPPGAPAPRRNTGLFVGVGIVVVVLLGGLIFGLTRILDLGSDDRRTDGPLPPSPTQAVCPQDETPITERPPQPGDGRVHGGQLSFPEQGAPWSEPYPDNRIAFGRDAWAQQVPIETDPDWVAGVFVADLVAGDGFFGPEQGAAVVLECITGEFYGDTEVTRNDERSEAITVDGHEAWIIETWLGFDIPNLEAKSEYVIVVIVETAPGAASVYFASVPENAPELIPTAQALVEQLQVS